MLSRLLPSLLSPVPSRRLAYYGMAGAGHVPPTATHGFGETMYATTILSVRKDGVVVSWSPPSPPLLPSARAHAVTVAV